jgi:phosphoribosylanthranilate isomerase
MTKIKICGTTRVEDAMAAAAFGADFIGMIFFPESARFVHRDRARAIAEAVRRTNDRTQLVGVFVNQDVEEMVDTCELVGLDLLQLHGSESPNVAARTQRPFIKAFRISDETPDTSTYSCDWVLFDTYSEKVAGGTGQTFQWNVLDSWPRNQKFFLGGGINPDNVAEAIRRVRPDAIDVSSGVEDGPGLKNHDKLKRLFEAVRST